MTTHAYQEIYLNKAQRTLGDAFDYAINTCNIEGQDFINLFTSSTVSKRMENGDPSILMGKSGIEIANEVIVETKGKQSPENLSITIKHSAEHWIGWAISYYQWYSSRSYSNIFKVLTYKDLKNMYQTLHEADISKFIDIADTKVKSYYKETNLKRIRFFYGCSQAKLAKLSGVSLRSIQMYEQRNKDINKASAETLYRLSKVLGCTIEDLIEK